VDGARVVPVAADPVRAEHDPAWSGDLVLHTTVTAGQFTDVWSADATGGDRADVTARAGADETGPAYSADGLRLAYSAAQPGGGARIVVADADGGNPRTIAPVGTEPGDSDRDPTWSPDGTRLAFTRRPADGSPARILLVRVADAVRVGEVPMPEHLRGGDTEAAWSPDGTRLAVSRNTTPRESLVDPYRVDQPLLPGRGVDLAKKVRVPELPDRPDIVFLLDTTASMEDVIEDLKDNIERIVANFDPQRTNARFALATYETPGDTNHYKLWVDLTDSAAVLKDALGSIGTPGGGEEDWSTARHQAMQPTGSGRVSLRDGGSPIFVLIGDAPSTGTNLGNGEPDLERDQQKVIREMRDLRAKLVAVPTVTTTGELGLDHDVDGNGTGEATEIVDAVGGTVTDTTDPDQVTEAIIGGIVRTRVNVVPEVGECDPGLTVAFTPGTVTVEAGSTAEFTERLAVTGEVAPGSQLRCVVHFDVGSEVPEDQVRQDVLVRVADPTRPFVRVDDVTVTATGPLGARAFFRATARTPDGRPMPPP
ncbi:MAG TPA: VWA domain-containing protein, partial [Micromonospora sp.]